MGISAGITPNHPKSPPEFPRIAGPGCGCSWRCTTKERFSLKKEGFGVGYGNIGNLGRVGMEGVSWLDHDSLETLGLESHLEFGSRPSWLLQFPRRSWGLENRSIGNIHRECGMSLGLAQVWDLGWVWLIPGMNPRESQPDVGRDLWCIPRAHPDAPKPMEFLEFSGIWDLLPRWMNPGLIP